MKYEDIKDFNERCETHPDHQSGMISYGMIEQRLQEEIDELREYIEQHQWVGLTEDERTAIRAGVQTYLDMTQYEYGKTVQQATELKLQEKNT